MTVHDAGDAGLLTTLERAHREIAALDQYLLTLDLTQLTAAERVLFGLGLTVALTALAAAEAVGDLVTVLETDGAGGAHADPG